MKTIVIALVLLGTISCATAQLVTNQPARLKWKVECFEGKSPGIGGNFINTPPEIIRYGNNWKDVVTSPGLEHNLAWSFVGRNHDKDVYQFTFTRMTQPGSSVQTTSSKEVQFNGRRIVVFDDDLHTVVMKSPNDEELKAAKNN